MDVWHFIILMFQAGLFRRSEFSLPILTFFPRLFLCSFISFLSFPIFLSGVRIGIFRLDARFHRAKAICLAFLSDIAIALAPLKQS